AAVEAVEEEDGCYRLRLESGESVRARQVVLAVPGPLVEGLVPSLPVWKREAIAAIPTESSITMCVVLDSPEGAPWEPVMFTPAVGCGFQCAFQPKVGPAWRPYPNGRAALVLYRHRDPSEPDHAEL